MCLKLQVHVKLSVSTLCQLGKIMYYILKHFIKCGQLLNEIFKLMVMGFQMFVGGVS